MNDKSSLLMVTMIMVQFEQSTKLLYSKYLHHLSSLYIHKLRDRAEIIKRKKEEAEDDGEKQDAKMKRKMKRREHLNHSFRLSLKHFFCFLRFEQCVICFGHEKMRSAK